MMMKFTSGIVSGIISGTIVFILASCIISIINSGDLKKDVAIVLKTDGLFSK
jgi:hypothetical protein